ncbi:MAG: metal dependent phosphohydrolase [Planctomycetaceae bacterium]|nr:metal dependent phosphohydrolase [Planctomycetaceae bacterium]
MTLIPSIVRLCEFVAGEQGDCFALLATKEASKTRDGKPYYRVGFRDAKRVATAMIWNDTGWFPDCESKWTVGEFYKIRCSYTENNYGPQIEIDRIRIVDEADRQQGFNPDDFFDRTRFDIEAMFAELVDIAEQQISEVPLRALVLGLVNDHADLIKRMSAASRNHHSFIGGYLEHVLSVTRTAVYFANKYADYYPDLTPPLSISLVVAGAILHDIGKTLELDHQPSGADYTAAGRLIGHILLGRDMVRDKSREVPDLNPETLLRLEHIIVAHQNLPEWGSPVAPHTPEAFLVHMADDTDAKFAMFAKALAAPIQSGDQFTSRDNGLKRRLFRGLFTVRDHE